MNKISREIVVTLEKEAQELNKRLVKLRENNGDFNQYIAVLKSLKEVLALITTYDNDNGNHPIFTLENMALPRDRRERNEWCRHFYRVDSTVASAIDLHTELPISNFTHSCEDLFIKKLFDNMAFEKLDIVNLLLNIGLEYWKIGDVFPFGQLNETDGMWERFTLLNPDYINISSSSFISLEDLVIEMIPDSNLREIVKNGINGKLSDTYKQLSPDIIKTVQMDKNIILDNKLVSHISHKASQYDTYGTPLLMRCFKTLIRKDKLIRAQEDTSLIQEELLNNLGVSQEILDNKNLIDINSTETDILNRRYISYKLILESWIKNKIYKPISEIQGFYKPINGEIALKYMSDKQKKISIDQKDVQLIIPQISW